jgi:hypothetical protein
VIAVVLGLLWSSSLYADYKRAYYEGYQLARQGRDWETVAVKMTEALQENDREGEMVVLTSANVQPYLPYFYLGLARFQLGDCRGARENWIKSSVQKKVVLSGRERQWFNQFSPICELSVPIEDALKQAQARLQSVDQLARDADLAKVWSQEAGFAATLTKLRQQLDQAGKDFQQARAAKVDQQLALLTGVKAATNDLSEQMDTLLKNARGRRDDLLAQRLANERRLLDEKKTGAEATVAGNTGTGGGPGTAGGGTGRESKPADARGGEIKGVDPRPVDPKGGDPRTTTAAALQPPDGLRALMQQYVQGRYREAHDGLQSQAVPAEWRAHAALLRAASAFSLYYAEGQKDRGLLDEASRAVQACAQANRDLRPSRRLFAPPFIEFFDRHAGPRPATRAAQR